MLENKSEVERFEKRSPKSRQFSKDSSQFLPGGDSRSTSYYLPYPLIFTDGKGSHIYDIDGIKRLDFANNFTSLILGHSNQIVSEAIKSQISKGLGLFSPTIAQANFARRLCERVPSVDRVRFTNSGTEATMYCIRAARVYTGKEKIAKCEGGYHGTHDSVFISVRPHRENAGDIRYPIPIPETPGLPRKLIDDILILPYNDPSGAETLISQHADELAAVIVEPVQGTGGMIPATYEFLSALRETTRKHGILLIFDEVISLRLAPGGAQDYFRIIPDLTAMGKFIGGGLPIGAFGGEKTIMSLFDPSKKGGPVIPHAGSYNGNPAVMEAGSATLDQLTPPIYRRLEALGEALRAGIRALATEVEFPIQVSGIGSLFGIHLTNNPINCYRDTTWGDNDLRHQIFLGLLNEGYVLSSRLLGCISTTMTPEDVESLLEGLRTVLTRQQLKLKK